jgi:hypothetical protein
MAHEVSAKLHTKVVAHKDLEIEIKTIDDGKSSKLGTLLISKGNIEWLPKGNSVNKKRLSWVQFAALVEEHGKTVKVKLCWLTLRNKKRCATKPRSAPDLHVLWESASTVRQFPLWVVTCLSEWQ